MMKHFLNNKYNRHCESAFSADKAILSKFIWIASCLAMTVAILKTSQKKIFYLLIFVFISKISISQELTEREIDSISYQQYYVVKDWNFLLSLESRIPEKYKNNFNVYHRLGTAYYATNKPFKAVEYFKKASTFNSYDEVNNAYLYYALLKTENYAEADYLKPTITQKANKKVVSGIYIDGGFKLTSKPDTSFALYNGSVGLEHRINPYTSVYHAYSLSQQQQYFGIAQQQQYYIKSSIYLGHGLTFMPSFNFAFINIVGNDNSAVYIDITNPSKYYVYGGNLQWSKSIFKLEAGFHYLNLDNKPVLQPNASVSFYPLKNEKLKVTASYSLAMQDTVNRHLLGADVSYKLKHNIKISANYFYANGNGFVEKNGLLLNNLTDITVDRIGVKFDFDIKENVGIFALYQYERRIMYYYNVPYFTNNLFVGVKYLFY